MQSKNYFHFRFLYVCRPGRRIILNLKLWHFYLAPSCYGGYFETKIEINDENDDDDVVLMKVVKDIIKQNRKLYITKFRERKSSTYK
ncbi:hypothetical protein DERP_008271 [Dermatophagoides pteronyssinus]|uniref:Uncharacterized protein n=1 Tax=Dermatophagoides pteronyssinus TaxID=6956 RepID=A0ABQ8J6M7_DERPT|nr:hypothetical protein DERP_008271 [Dermatophagoides pteronyssinus]